MKVETEHTRRAQAAAELAITLSIVRETQPDDPTLAAIAVECIADIEKQLIPLIPKK